MDIIYQPPIETTWLKKSDKNAPIAPKKSYSGVISIPKGSDNNIANVINKPTTKKNGHALTTNTISKINTIAIIETNNQIGINQPPTFVMLVLYHNLR